MVTRQGFSAALAAATAALLLLSPSGDGQATSAQPTCTFRLGFKVLHDLIPHIVGDCRADETHDPENGDAVQLTTGGMLVWRKADNWTAFTDGSTTWINGPSGLANRPNEGPPFSWEAAAPSAPAGGSGIEGQVVTGPRCPGPALGGTDCPDRAYQATNTVLDQQGRAVTRIRTDATGGFRVPLAPGVYTLDPEPPGPQSYPFAKEQAVSVTAGQFTQVRITYDTGIR